MSWIDADGTPQLPSFAFESEISLGFYRSAQSAVGLSYGQLQLPAGSGPLPSLAISSESSLGFFRSAASTLALSYGTLTAPNVGSTIDGIYLGNFSGVTRFQGQNVGIGLLNPANGFAKFSCSTLAVNSGAGNSPAMVFTSEISLGWYRSGASTIAQSYGTLNLATQAVRLSMRTLAASAVTASAAKTNVAVDEVVFTIGGASGASLIIYSGGTAYGFNSAFSAAAS